MRALTTLIATVLTVSTAGITSAMAQIPGRNGLIYFTTPDQVDTAPDCGVTINFQFC